MPCRPPTQAQATSSTNTTALIGGPYLVRNATLSRSGELALRGDLNASTLLTVIASPEVRSVSWNGFHVPTDFVRSSRSAVIRTGHLSLSTSLLGLDVVGGSHCPSSRSSSFCRTPEQTRFLTPRRPTLPPLSIATQFARRRCIRSRFATPVLRSVDVQRSMCKVEMGLLPQRWPDTVQSRLYARLWFRMFSGTSPNILIPFVPIFRSSS